MNALDDLKAALLDLVRAVGDEIPLIVGGVFGLYLRQLQRNPNDRRRPRRPICGRGPWSLQNCVRDLVRDPIEITQNPAKIKQSVN